MSQAIVAVVLIPLVAAIATSLVVLRSERAARLLVGAGATAHALAVVAVAAGISGTGGDSYSVGGWAAPLGIVLVVDSLSVFFLFLIAAGHVVFLAHAFVEERSPRKGMWILTELFVAALSGMVVAGDLFNLFVFLELASVASIGLITHKQRAEGAGAGFVYLLFASISGLLFLLAVILLYSGVGVLTLAEIAAAVDRMPPVTHRVSFGLLIASLGIKFGLVPFHFWQAPAYSAAGSSVAALLSGTGMKVYLYVLIRLLIHTLRGYEVAPLLGTVILVFGLTNIISGHILALAERDLKRLLAFSSVAHVGYILIALSVVFAAGTSATRHAAATAVLLHIVFHALIKSVLFYSGRTLVDRGGTSVLEGLRGVGRRELVGFGAFILASLALVGIPPTSGFYSKWRIALSAYRDFGVTPVVVIAAGTVISMLY
ncbi:MAG: complex I subunit 5 family protein, partial [Spirochaetota bacterium]